MQALISRDGTRIAYERRGMGPPLLFIHGGWTDHTAPYLQGTTETLAAVLPDARVVVLPGQQHSANITAPGLLATEILRFLTT